MLTPISISVLSLTLGGCGPKSTPETAAPEQAATEAPAAEETPAAPISKTVAAADADFKAINPEKPDGPSWIVLSGNPGETAFAAMVKLPAGYASALHSHSANFNAVVVSGTVTNGRTADDAVELAAGDMWSQPSAEAHYTGCTADADCVFVGTMDGAFGSEPAETAVEASTQVVMKADEIDFAPLNPEQPQGPQIKMVQGDRTAGAWMAFAKFPAGLTTPEHTHTASYSGALISGEMPHGDVVLTAGSHWARAGSEPHVTECKEGADCIFFVSMDGAMDMKPTAAPAEEAPAE